MAGVTCGVMLLLLLAIPAIGIAAYFSHLKIVNKQLQDAHTAYWNSLNALKQRPHDPDLRQRALGAGRYYSNLTRNKRGVTVYDEVALGNDIAAACAGSVRVAMPTPTLAASTLEQRLARLKELLDSGAIAEQEYRERRAKILEEV